ncbi:MAG: hypothetical protein ACJAR2_000716 [Ilumatobacter sp.]|jgi:hypothetical protein
MDTPQMSNRTQAHHRSLQLNMGSIVLAHKANLNQPSPGSALSCDHPLCLSQRAGKRLFTQNVSTPLDSGNGQRDVRVVRGGDDDRIKRDIGGNRLWVGRRHRPAQRSGLSSCAADDVGNHHDFNFVEMGQVGDMFAAHPACTDDTDSNRHDRNHMRSLALLKERGGVSDSGLFGGLGFLRQTQNALANDVALDLASSAPDRLGSGEEER